MYLILLLRTIIMNEMPNHVIKKEEHSLLMESELICLPSLICFFNLMQTKYSKD